MKYPSFYGKKRDKKGVKKGKSGEDPVSSGFFKRLNG